MNITRYDATVLLDMLKPATEFDREQATMLERLKVASKAHVEPPATQHNGAVLNTKQSTQVPREKVTVIEPNDTSKKLTNTLLKAFRKLSPEQQRALLKG